MGGNNCFEPEKELKDCSKEELMEMVKCLREENKQLLSGSLAAKTVKESSCKSKFKEKYALQILDSLPDMLTVVSDSGIMLELISSEKTNHIGVSLEEIEKGLDVKNILSKESYANMLKNIRHVTKTQECASSVHTLHVNGETHHYDNRIFPLETGYKLSMCRDETESIIAKRALENISYAINNANEGIFAVTSDGKFIFVNKQFLEDHNLKDDDALGYEVLYTIKDKKEWEEMKAAIHANGNIYKYTSDVKKTDGTKVSYELVVHLAKYQDDIEAYWFFARDVTLRRNQELKIRELNDLMNGILNNIPVCLFVKDTGDDFRYLYWNNAFEDYSGIPASKAVGNTDFDIFPDINDAKRFRRDDLELLKKGDRVELQEDYSPVGSGEKRIVNTVKLLVPRENEEPLLIGVSFDITEMKKVEQQLIEAKMAAEESNRLKTTFLANMSHEIRTPLNAIVGFSQLISTAETEEEKQQFSAIIDSNADLLLQLINDILDLSKIEAGTLSLVKAPMNFTDLCKTMYEVHKSKTKEGVSLIFEGGHSDLPIVNDRNRLAQLFTNLLTNAIKFTNKGDIRFGYVVKNGFIESYVKDTGIGVSKDNLDIIFDRFVKLNTFVQGTGLGLSITKMIVEKLGGTISVDSVEGEGTEFRFAIPYVNESGF